MKKILLVLLAFCAFAMKAQITEVSGNQSGMWDGEIHIIDDVVVPDGQTLTINAGTNVISDGYYGITVLGYLYALGDDDARITFTVADTTGYCDYENPELGGWKGIYCAKPNGVRLDYCDFSYGKGQEDADGGMLYIKIARDVEISNCRFHHNMTRRRGGAIYAENSVLNIHDSEVYDNIAVAMIGGYTWGVGFHFLKCDLDIHDIAFHDNYSETAYGGGMNIDSCNMLLTNSTFYNNTAVNAGGLGIQRCKEYTVKVANMLAYNNAVRHYGGGLAMATSDPELNNLTIVENYCGGGGGAGMQTAFDACPTLNNCIFWGNHAIYSLNNNDTVEYYNGSQIWLWGSDCYPKFNNGVVQYGLDSIFCFENIEVYNEMNGYLERMQALMGDASSDKDEVIDMYRNIDSTRNNALEIMRYYKPTDDVTETKNMKTLRNGFLAIINTVKASMLVDNSYEGQRGINRLSLETLIPVMAFKLHHMPNSSEEIYTSQYFLAVESVCEEQIGLINDQITKTKEAQDTLAEDAKNVDVLFGDYESVSKVYKKLKSKGLTDGSNKILIQIEPGNKRILSKIQLKNSSTNRFNASLNDIENLDGEKIDFKSDNTFDIQISDDIVISIGELNEINDDINENIKKLDDTIDMLKKKLAVLEDDKKRMSEVRDDFLKNSAQEGSNN